MTASERNLDKRRELKTGPAPYSPKAARVGAGILRDVLETLYCARCAPDELRAEATDAARSAAWELYRWLDPQDENSHRVRGQLVSADTPVPSLTAGLTERAQAELSATVRGAGPDPSARSGAHHEQELARVGRLLEEACEELFGEGRSDWEELAERGKAALADLGLGPF